MKNKFLFKLFLALIVGIFLGVVILDVVPNCECSCPSGNVRWERREHEHTKGLEVEVLDNEGKQVQIRIEEEKHWDWICVETRGSGGTAQMVSPGIYHFPSPVLYVTAQLSMDVPLDIHNVRHQRRLNHF